MTSYGRIKETTIGGIFMLRSYGHIKEYEKEKLELRERTTAIRSAVESIISIKV